MRKMIIGISVMPILCAILISCVDDVKDVSKEISVFCRKFDWYEPCIDYYTVLVVDSTDAFDRDAFDYYWLALRNMTDNKYVVICHTGSQISYTDDYSDGYLTLMISASHEIDPLDNYAVFVFRSPTWEMAGDTTKYEKVGKSYDFRFVDSLAVTDWTTEDSCNIKCCTQSYGRGYALYESQVDDLIGVKATMETTYGKLCGEYVNSTEPALACNWCSVAKVNLGTTFWAQCGTKTLRKAGQSKVDTTFYTEVRYDQDSVEYFYSSDVGWDYFPEHSIHDLICELSTDDGTWQFSFDDLPAVESYPYAIWLTPGTYIQWSAEVSNPESDMGGGFGDTLKFWDIEYLVQGDLFYIPKFFGYDIFDTLVSDNPNEWIIWIDTTLSGFERLLIWDSQPLP